MAVGLAKDERLVCIGQTALRGPDGKPLPAVPMYIKVKAEAVDRESGLSEGEQELVNNISGIFAGKMKAYIDGGGIS